MDMLLVLGCICERSTMVCTLWSAPHRLGYRSCIPYTGEMHLSTGIVCSWRAQR